MSIKIIKPLIMHLHYFTPLYRVKATPTRSGYDLLLQRKFWFLWICVQEKFISDIMVKHRGLFTVMSDMWLGYIKNKNLAV